MHLLPLVSSIEHYPGLGKSDHECLVFNVICNKQLNKNNCTRRNIFKANFTEIEKNLECIDWNSILTGDISQAYQRFCEALDKATEGNIPVVKGNFKQKNNLFMTKEAFKLRKSKNNHWKKYKISKSRRDHAKFKESRDKLRRTTRRLREQFELQITTSVKPKPKPFWKYVASRLKTRLDIPTLTFPYKEKAVTELEKAETLNTYFSSVFTDENKSIIPSISNNLVGTQITIIKFTSEMVRTKILSLNENKSPGPDNIHPFFLKRLTRVLCLPISMLFNLSMRSGTNAEQWREAIITAIHKKGARDLAENYKPISLTSIIIKLMESFIRDAILPHMVKNKFFNSNQHGFLPRRNCTTQLLEVIESWYETIEKKGYIDVIYTDFAKAFDSVPHV